MPLALGYHLKIVGVEYDHLQGVGSHHLEGDEDRDPSGTVVIGLITNSDGVVVKCLVKSGGHRQATPTWVQAGWRARTQRLTRRERSGAHAVTGMGKPINAALLMCTLARSSPSCFVRSANG